jgi:putative phosphoesterase
MRRLAVISDVHSNLEALHAVLGAIEGEDVYCLGDSVGYGANPNEVLQLLRDRGAKAVMGNHDQAAVTGETGRFNARAAMAALWTRGRLERENMNYLQGLPLELREEFDGANAYMAHGSPDDRIWEYVDPRSHMDLFAHYLSKTGCVLVALGHTHVPYSWSGEAGRVFNPGSVGQPRDGDPRASYAVVTVDGGAVALDLRRVEYDARGAARKILEAGLPPQFADRLLVGR